MTQPVRRLANPWGFFAATYLASWLLWGLAAVSTPDGQPSLLLLVAGASVPSIMGIVFIYLTKDGAGRRDFWRRVVDVRRISPRWWLVIVFLYPAVYTLVAVLYALLGGTLPSLTALVARSAGPMMLVELVVANFVVSGLSEELGWRGYALDPLQGRWRALGGSLILGLAHSFWHTPLFLIPGISQGQMGLLSPDYLLFLATGFAVAVTFTWIYNNTGRSILAAILIHGFHNLSLDFLTGLQGALPTGFNAVNAAVQLTLAAILVAIWGAGTLTGRPEKTSPVHTVDELVGPATSRTTSAANGRMSRW